MGDSSDQEQTKPTKMKPSEICFSQREISHRFRKRSDHWIRTIGETLDDIVVGKTHVTSLPTINVKEEEDAEVNGDEEEKEGEGKKKKTRWITADNRRLWIFRHLERLGRCHEITIDEVIYIDSRKRSSTNRGASVTIIDDEEPGGYWHEAPDVTYVDPMNVKFTKNIIAMTFSVEGYYGVKVQTLVEKLESKELDFKVIPSIVIWDDGASQRVIDGNRRLWAFQKAEQSKIAAIVIKDREFLNNTIQRLIGKSLSDLSSGYGYQDISTES
ncbi:uncharacterized protein [Argopecten irradians]|uniref:uncharacterized protein isoform X3 n=1 Tax=Argopecten irradians TaxID=31199 RepID=UPI00371F36E3